MTKRDNFGPNLVVFGHKILIFTGESNSFGTHITEKGTLFALFFGQTWDEMRQKCQYLAQNDQKCKFWTKFGRFWAKILILTGGSKSFDTHITEKPPRLLVRIVLVMHGTKKSQKFGRFLAKNPNSYRRKQKFWYPYSGRPPRHLAGIVFWLARESIGPKMPIFCKNKTSFGP